MFTAVAWTVLAGVCFGAEGVFSAMAEEAVVEKKTTEAVNTKFEEAFKDVDTKVEQIVTEKIDQKLDQIIEQEVIKKKLDRKIDDIVRKDMIKFLQEM